MASPFFVYILRCVDNSLYTGITTDVRRRFAEHRGRKRGAKYTASHTPLRLECAWRTDSRASALRLEYRLKALTHAQKEQLIGAPHSLPVFLGHQLDCSVYQEELL